MNKYDIVRKIEEFAPLETQENWDCSGWIVERDKDDEQPFPIDRINRHFPQRVMFALTVTDDVVNQALKLGCNMIICHHPLFYVPLWYRQINIYAAHTNLDIAEGGTTDFLIQKLGFTKTRNDGFVRIVELENEMTVEELRNKLLQISPRLRYVNNQNVQTIKTIGFCAGSGSEFIGNTDAFVTGDLKFHTALDAKSVVFDIGHFESEIFAPELLSKITGIKGVIANEKSPFM